MRFLSLSLILLVFSMQGYAGRGTPLHEDLYSHPFSLGFMAGYGTTSWAGLVPAKDNQAPALSLSTPIDANEGGAAWGIFMGYELTPYFGLEGSYMQYPDAVVSFSDDSLFAFDHDGLNHFSTKTSVLSLIGRILVTVPNTKLRLYSGTGVASVHRKDILKDDSLITPNFVFGATYHIQPQVLAEVGAYFTVGYGEANLQPANEFIPFLYSLMLKVAYLV